MPSNNKIKRFDFQGELLENGQRVITGVNDIIEVDTSSIEPGEKGSGRLTFDENNKLSMSLKIPKGEKGEIPKIEPAIMTVSPGVTPSITFPGKTEDGKDI